MKIIVFFFSSILCRLINGLPYLISRAEYVCTRKEQTNLQLLTASHTTYVDASQSLISLYLPILHKIKQNETKSTLQNGTPRRPHTLELLHKKIKLNKNCTKKEVQEFR